MNNKRGVATTIDRGPTEKSFLAAPLCLPTLVQVIASGQRYSPKWLFIIKAINADSSTIKSGSGRKSRVQTPYLGCVSRLFCLLLQSNIEHPAVLRRKPRADLECNRPMRFGFPSGMRSGVRVNRTAPQRCDSVRGIRHLSGSGGNLPLTSCLASGVRGDYA